MRIDKCQCYRSGIRHVWFHDQSIHVHVRAGCMHNCLYISKSRIKLYRNINSLSQRFIHNACITYFSFIDLFTHQKASDRKYAGQTSDQRRARP